MGRQHSKELEDPIISPRVQKIHGLAALLGFKRESIVGHDIGLMVAYANASQYPAEVDRIVLMDAFLPGVGDWKSVWLLRDL